MWGFSDSASLYINVPVALQYKDPVSTSYGLADTTVQLEYSIFERSSATNSQQATVVGAINFPTGSNSKSPPTGDGNASYFIGFTYNQSFVEWYWFASPALLLANKQPDVLYGAQYWYELGIGHSLHSVPDKYILAFMTEFDGEYLEKDRVDGAMDPDSGGNTIYITPSLWFSTKKFIAQFGVAIPAVQQLNGEQDKTKYFITSSFGWTFDL